MTAEEVAKALCAEHDWDTFTEEWETRQDYWLALAVAAVRAMEPQRAERQVWAALTLCEQWERATDSRIDAPQAAAAMYRAMSIGGAS